MAIHMWSEWVWLTASMYVCLLCNAVQCLFPDPSLLVSPPCTQYAPSPRTSSFYVQEENRREEEEERRRQEEERGRQEVEEIRRQDEEIWRQKMERREEERRRQEEKWRRKEKEETRREQQLGMLKLENVCDK